MRAWREKEREKRDGKKKEGVRVEKEKLKMRVRNLSEENNERESEREILSETDRKVRDNGFKKGPIIQFTDQQISSNHYVCIHRGNS